MVGRTVKAVLYSWCSRLAILFDDGTVFAVEAARERYDDGLELNTLDELEMYDLRNLELITDEQIKAYQEFHDQKRAKDALEQRRQSYLLLKHEFEGGPDPRPAANYAGLCQMVQQHNERCQ